MLDWSLKNVTNQSTVCFCDDGTGIQMQAVTRQLIFFTERIGMSRITIENHVEFWKRANTWERVHGHCLFVTDADDKPVGCFISLHDVKVHVGLSTNARRLTEHKFYDEIIEALVQDVEVNLRSEREKCELLSIAKVTPPNP